MTDGYIPLDGEDMTKKEILSRAYLIATKTIKNKDGIIKTIQPKADKFDADGLTNLLNIRNEHRHRITKIPATMNAHRRFSLW